MNGIRRQLSSSLQAVERKIDKPSSLESLASAISILDNESTEIGPRELSTLGSLFREIGADDSDGPTSLLEQLDDIFYRNKLPVVDFLRTSVESGLEATPITTPDYDHLLRSSLHIQSIGGATPSHYPASIAHNSDPNSCYVAALLNIMTFTHDSVKNMLAPTHIADNLMGEEEKTVAYECLKSLENVKDYGRLYDVLSPLSEGDRELEVSSTTVLREHLAHMGIEMDYFTTQLSDIKTTIDTTSAMYKPLEDPIDAFLAASTLKEKDLAMSLLRTAVKEQSLSESDVGRDIETRYTRVKHQTAKTLTTLLKDQMLIDAQHAFSPAVSSLSRGDSVSLEQVKTIQATLTQLNMTGRDDNIHNEDPKEILSRLFELSELGHTHYTEQIRAVGVGVGEEVEDPGPDMSIEAERPTSEGTGTFFPLSSTTLETNIQDALDDYFSATTTVTNAIVKEPDGRFIRYDSVDIITTKTVEAPPPVLFLQIQNEDDIVSFQNIVKITHEDEPVYYELVQVECHSGSREVGHEYSYLQKDGRWYTSDDLDDRTHLTGLEESKEDISTRGTLFIYRQLERPIDEAAEIQLYHHDPYHAPISKLALDATAREKFDLLFSAIEDKDLKDFFITKLEKIDPKRIGNALIGMVNKYSKPGKSIDLINNDLRSEVTKQRAKEAQVPHGPCLKEVLTFKSTVQTIKRAMEDAHKMYPSAHINRLLTSLNGELKGLEKVESGQRIADQAYRDGFINNVNGIHAEFKTGMACIKEGYSVVFSDTAPFETSYVDIDVTRFRDEEDVPSSKSWIEVKNYKSFSKGSKTFEEIDKQIKKLQKAAEELSPSPHVMINFANDVNPDVLAYFKGLLGESNVLVRFGQS